MRTIHELLHQALACGDRCGVKYVRSKHLTGDVLQDLATTTYNYLLAHADSDRSSGKLVYRDGIESWWRQAGDLSDEEFTRLYRLRGDVVMKLTADGMVFRPHPRSVPLYVYR
jgi:hypothetical protein